VRLLLPLPRPASRPFPERAQLLFCVGIVCAEATFCAAAPLLPLPRRMKSGTFPPPSLKAEADPELTYKSLDANSNNILDSVSLIILSLSSIKVCWR
jgi:hypothetical protein